jgi:hypothetical protein
MRKPEIESLEALMAEELARWDREAIADELLLEDLEESDSYCELQCGERPLDEHRWELDPASAEDYRDRDRAWRMGPSQRWRHFGH